MNKLFTFLLLFLAATGFAQPANDDCGGIIDLGAAPYCPGNQFFTNVDATASAVPNINGCLTGGNSPRDVWFQFTADATITDYEITVTGIDDGSGSTPLNTPQMVLYRGFCLPDELLIMDCVQAGLGESSATIEITGLTPGLTYFLRIGDYSPAAPNSGTFEICIQEKDPEINIDQGSSDACAGILYDTGGPDGDYGANEDNTFTICPTDFHQCISLYLEYYNLEDGADELIIYDGDNTSAPEIAHIGDGFSGNPNDGGVGYQLYASSGCVTIQFITDGTTQFEGFKAIWQCTQEACPQPELITVDPDADTTTIVGFLNTDYATTHIDTIICDNAAYGSFEATAASGLGIERGILLTSGHAVNAIGPNDSGSTSESLFSPGDADLDALSILLGEGNTSNDACVVILDVYAYSDKLTFEYTFGSEEYKEFVGTSFNDIFAFLVSGPGIVGEPTLNNQQNIAILPNSNTPVQINSVNHVDNWQYFHSNDLGESIQYDGLTSDSLGIKKTLTAEIGVVPCNSYKIKLAVADRGDSAYDSGVFISEIKAGAPHITLNFQSGVDYLIENCTDVDDILVIELDGETTTTSTYNVSITGTATNGVDYTLNVPNQLTFSPDQTSFSFPISVIDDAIPEGTETIIITLSRDYGCGEVVFDDLIVEIKDNLDVNASIVGDTLDVCIEDGIQLSASGAATYQWSPEPIMSDPYISDPFALPQASGWVFVTGAAGLCTNKDSVYLDIHNVQVVASVSDNQICVGEQVQLSSTPTVTNPTYAWTPAAVTDPTSQNTNASPQVTTNYIIKIEKAGCVARDTVTVFVDTLFTPMLIADTTICSGQSLPLAMFPINTTSTYAWTPPGTLDDASSSSPVATPGNGETIYTLTTTSKNGYCSETDNVTINAVYAELNVLNMPALEALDTVFLCSPDSAKLYAQTTTLGVGLSWLPSNGTLSSLTDTIVTAKPQQSGLYIATLTVGGCILHDSTYVQIDSLPDLSLTSVPIKDPYCPGDTVSIFSENYDQDAYPGISHAWAPASGTISGLTDFNLVVITQDTITYTRVSRNGVCVDSSSVVLNVDHPADITVTQDKDTICGGDPVQLGASSPDGDNFTWTPENDLSCVECADPIASPYGTITYLVSLKDANCPSMEPVTIFVKPTPTIQFPEDRDLCLNESITLNEDNNATYTYSWTADDPDFGTVTVAQPTVTPTQTTTYSVTVNNGVCTLTEDITVNVATDELTIEGPDGLCPGYPITLNAVTNGTGDYVWMPDNSFGQSIEVQPSVATTYSVTYTYGDGCVLTASHDVAVYQAYNVSLTAEKDTVYSGELINVHASVSPTLSNPTFKWIYNGIEQSETGANFSVNASAAAADFFNVTLITPDGCEYSVEINVVVLPVTYQLPNAFTPNGDAINDVFRLAVLEGYEFSKMRVFNRWGNLVYSGDSPFKGWDGQYNGKDMPSDVYPYVVDLIAPDGSKKSIKGDVTLIR